MGDRIDKIIDEGLKQPMVLPFPVPDTRTTKEKTSKEKGFFACKPNGTFPAGCIPARTVKVSMAVGMYQYHDLLSSHVDPYDKRFLKDNYDDTNDNNPPEIFGYLNT